MNTIGDFLPRPTDTIEELDLHDNVATRLFGPHVERKYFQWWMTIRPFSSFLLVLGELTCLPAFFGDYSLAWVICSILFLFGFFPYILVMNFKLLQRTIRTFEYWYLTLNNITLLISGVLMLDFDSRSIFMVGIFVYFQIANTWDGLPRPLMFPNRRTRGAFIAGFAGGVCVGAVIVIGFRVGWVTRVDFQRGINWGPRLVGYSELAAQCLLTMTIFLGKNLIKFIRSPNALNLIKATLEWAPYDHDTHKLLLPLTITVVDSASSSGVALML